MATKELPQDLTDRIAREENEADRAAINKYIVEPVKSAGKKLYENVMGTPEQNRIAKESMEKAKSKGMKKGGSVSSASKRADGCCIRGKTRA